MPGAIALRAGGRNSSATGAGRDAGERCRACARPKKSGASSAACIGTSSLFLVFFRTDVFLTFVRDFLLAVSAVGLLLRSVLEQKWPRKTRRLRVIRA